MGLVSALLPNTADAETTVRGVNGGDSLAKDEGKARMALRINVSKLFRRASRRSLELRQRRSGDVARPTGLSLSVKGRGERLTAH